VAQPGGRDGTGSFFYNGLGYCTGCKGPDYKYYWTSGSTLQTCTLHDVPKAVRRFSPAQVDDTLWQFNSNSPNEWVVDKRATWGRPGIGTDCSDMEADKGYSGDLYYITETHVKRGWKWVANYTTLPDPIKTHLFDNAIYKPTHVDADTWTERPDLLSA
jgi:hypothetical protein